MCISSSPTTSTPAAERMAAIDFLESMALTHVTAESAAQARDALVDIATRNVPEGTDKVTKRALVGEKYDAFVALTRIDPDVAFATYGLLSSPEQRQVLAPALMTGLVDVGVPRDRVHLEFAERERSALNKE